MTRMRRRHFGFTLPEVLASLVLVGLVLPAVMKGVSLAMSAADDARKRVEAVGLAETKLEEIVASASTNAAGSTSGDFGDAWPAYRWRSASNNMDTGLTEITVSVVWTSRGAERSVDLAGFAYASSTTATATAGGSSSSSTGTGGSGGSP